MAFDLHAVQADIKNYLSTTFTQFDFYTNAIPEDLQVPRNDDEVDPFFVIQNGPLWPRPRGKSIVGARNDDYYSWTQVIGVGSVEEHVSSALSLVTDRLIGYKPIGAGHLYPDGGMSDYGSRQFSVRPVLYYQSQRFEYSVIQNGIGSYLVS